ncbi:MAG TPA: hypothetical protein VLH10_26915 [Yinghuangia sp.]|uniref:hypothetical protein n=1 Tax=Yinghuangia sp. YIM S10712 TaxID=3436930 RepID=UPI002C4E85B8|nr:hypothetical protein [Yinghuangia sp.]
MAGTDGDMGLGQFATLLFAVVLLGSVPALACAVGPDLRCAPHPVMRYGGEVAWPASGGRERGQAS